MLGEFQEVKMGTTKEAWIKRKEKYGFSGVGNPEEWSKNLSKALKGKLKPWFKGRKLSDAHKLKIGKASRDWHIKNKYTEKGKIRSQNISNSLKGRNFHGIGQFKKGEMSGEKHPRWRGGIWKKGYTSEFSNEIKYKIRERDSFTCQECFMLEKEIGQNLDVHHIDFNKKNNEIQNLISLCRRCHSGLHANVELNKKVDRQVVIEHYQRIVLERRIVKT